MKTLSLGSSGPAVTAWQAFLVRKGQYAGAVDGAFGPATEKASKAFQQGVGLTPDGIVGPETLKAAVGAGFDPPQGARVADAGAHSGRVESQTTAPGELLSVGTTGPAVAAWQSFLIQKGCYRGALDGAFGPATEAATKAFQQGLGLSADGIVGPQTLAAALQAGFKLPEPTSPSRAGADGCFILDAIDGVLVYQLNDSKAVFYIAGMDIDADGSPQAYNPADTGLDVNADARDGDTWCGVALDEQGNPVVQGATDPAPGFYVSTTSLQDASKPASDPRRYVDASAIPYIVIPGEALGPAQIGHPVLVIDERTGNRACGIVADRGPRDKIGEASMFLAAQLVGEAVYRLNDPDPDKFSNPRTGGSGERRFRYVIFTARSPASWPQTVAQIEQAVGGALRALPPWQLVTALTARPVEQPGLR